MDDFFILSLKNNWKMVLKKKLFTNDRSVIITTLRHVFSEKIIITAVNNGARTVYVCITKLSGTQMFWELDRKIGGLGN